jgi:hypothetical protein
VASNPRMAGRHGSVGMCSVIMGDAMLDLREAWKAEFPGGFSSLGK